MPASGCSFPLHAPRDREGIETNHRSRRQKAPRPPGRRNDRLGGAFSWGAGKRDGRGRQLLVNPQSTRSTQKPAPKTTMKSPMARNNDRHIARGLLKTTVVLLPSGLIPIHRTAGPVGWRRKATGRPAKPISSSIFIKRNKGVGRDGENAGGNGVFGEAAINLRIAQDRCNRGWLVLFDLNKPRIMRNNRDEGDDPRAPSAVGALAVARERGNILAIAGV